MHSVPYCRLHTIHAQKRKELSAITEGPVLLVEYLEEQPLLLPQMGMGARLTTVYRKTSTNDTAHHQLRNESRPWQVGAVHALAPEDESPLLGNIKRGTVLYACDVLVRCCRCALPCHDVLLLCFSWFNHQEPAC